MKDRAGEATPPSTVRYLPLDGLRALAILLVLSSHLRAVPGYPSLPTWYWHLGDLGNLGVRVFFVLSGFIITHLLVREATKTGRASLSDFYRRRAYRILPPLLFLLIAMLGLRAVGLVQFPTGQWLRALFFVGNLGGDGSWVLGHLWSLAVEEQFYVVWPLIFVGLGPLGATRCAMAACMVGPVSRALLSPSLPDHTGILQNVDGLAMGCLAALALGSTLGARWTAWSRAVPSWAWLLLAFAGNLGAIPSLLKVTLGFPVTHFAVASLVLRIVDDHRGTDVLRRLLALPAMVWIGTLSYSLYLWQQVFTDRLGLGAEIGFPLNLVAAVICATGSLYLIERPALRLRHRREARTLGAAAGTT